MKTIPPEDFPPLHTRVIERDDRRVVLLHVGAGKLELAVWLRRIEDARPTVLGGWYCSPDAGLSLTHASARALLAALTDVLRT